MILYNDNVNDNDNDSDNDNDNDNNSDNTFIEHKYSSQMRIILFIYFR